MINTIILGHVLNVLPKLPTESVSCIATSPPYWGLRDYGIEPVIWDGVEGCEHEWGNEKIVKAEGLAGSGVGKIHIGNTYNPREEGLILKYNASQGQFCLKCNAWRGSLGLEPQFELYIKHLCDIFDEGKRVLRKDGTCWVNIGDTYFGSGQDSGKYGEFSQEIGKRKIGIAPRYNLPTQNKANKISKKSLCDIPYRFSIEMINRGWIKRNTIIWHKPNCMPSSAPDRFTVDFEYLFFFTKNNKTLFWTNEKTLECVSKQPPGIKGIEGKDWEWRSCPACSNKNYFNIRTRDVIRKEKDCPQFKASDKEKENIENKICPRCKGLKKIKYSFWTGHDYWFEQQFDELQSNEYDINRLRKKPKYNNKTEQTAVVGRATSNHIEQGRNKRCVWIIPTQPFPEAHFAVYPEGLIEIPIKAGCPEFICKKCGRARVKILEPSEEYKKLLGKCIYRYKKQGNAYKNILTGASESNKSVTPEYIFKDYTNCGCNAGWESGIVLDPFMGSGTTAKEALKQRKRFIGIDIKQEYIDMSYRKIARVQQKIF